MFLCIFLVNLQVIPRYNIEVLIFNTLPSQETAPKREYGFDIDIFGGSSSRRREKEDRRCYKLVVWMPDKTCGASEAVQGRGFVPPA